MIANYQDGFLLQNYCKGMFPILIGLRLLVKTINLDCKGIESRGHNKDVLRYLRSAILLHETYTNLDRLAVQFLLQPRETAPSSPQAFTDKLSAFFVQFSRLIDPFKSLSITGPQF